MVVVGLLLTVSRLSFHTCHFKLAKMKADFNNFFLSAQVALIVQK